jgi:hypothetical protein
MCPVSLYCELVGRIYMAECDVWLRSEMRSMLALVGIIRGRIRSATYVQMA